MKHTFVEVTNGPLNWGKSGTLPKHIDLPDAPFAMRGYRRKGPAK